MGEAVVWTVLAEDSQGSVWGEGFGLGPEDSSRCLQYDEVVAVGANHGMIVVA